MWLRDWANPDGYLFWVWAIPSYVAGAYVLLRLGRLMRDEIWYRQLVRRYRSLCPSI